MKVEVLRKGVYVSSMGCRWGFAKCWPLLDRRRAGGLLIVIEFFICGYVVLVENDCRGYQMRRGKGGKRPMGIASPCTAERWFGYVVPRLVVRLDVERSEEVVVRVVGACVGTCGYVCWYVSWEHASIASSSDTRSVGFASASAMA